MAKYTMELREIVNSNINIFNFDYEYYDPDGKKVFEQHFIDHFYFNEIGVETVGRFIHNLKCKMHETFPYYNMLMETALIDYRKTENYNLTETISRTLDQNGNSTSVVNGSTNQTGNTVGSSQVSGSSKVEGSGSNTFNSSANSEGITQGERSDTTTSKQDHKNKNEKTSTVEGNNQNIESDTPQGLLSMSDIKKNAYASNVSIADNKTSTKDTENDTLTSNDTSKVEEKNNSKTTSKTEDQGKSTDERQEITSTSQNTSDRADHTENITNSQDANINQINNTNENMTRTMKGSFGVITEADMLKKHIELQQQITNIELKFFNECSDLFMQIY